MLFFLYLSILAPAVAGDPPVTFRENKRQWPANIQYAAQIPGGSMVLEPGKFVYTFLDRERLEAIHDLSHQPQPDEGSFDGVVLGHRVEVNFINANKQSVPQPFGQSETYYNYFLGSDTSHWAARVHGYNGLLYPEFYTGINLKVYGQQQHVKYDLVVAPGADPSQIRLSYDGAESVMLQQGDLHLSTPLATIIEKKPVAYQYKNGTRMYVACEYTLTNNQLSFSFPQGYDPCYELVIDPLLIFSTYSGSRADNWGSTATPGEAGNLYSAGVTDHFVGQAFSGVFPATPGAFQTHYGGLYDAAILKYDSAGTRLLYASYLGGNESESPHSLVMNSDHELLVMGTTSSGNFPTTAGAFSRTFRGGVNVSHVVNYANGSDMFVCRISPDGTQLLASTFLGGTQNDGLNPTAGGIVRNYGDQLRGDIVTDAQGFVYISSVTASADFPSTNGLGPYHGGLTDAVLVKMDKELSTLIFSTFIGGTLADAAHTVKLAKDNSIYMAGGTLSSNFPVTAPAYQSSFRGFIDGWIARISPTGDAIQNATFTGTSSYDQVYFIDLNEAGEVFVYGQTTGSMPITAGVYNEPNSGQFIQKFDATLTTLQFSTVFGSGRGRPDISPTAFLVNECNNVYMTGWGGRTNNSFWSGSGTSGMHVTTDAFQTTTNNSDFYLLVLTDDATERLYATFFGGSRSQTHVDGGTSRFDKNGIVYHAVCSGCNADINGDGIGDGPFSDFPTTPNAWSRTNNSLNCNNAAFKFDLSSLKARLQTNSVDLKLPGLRVVCIPDKIVFQNLSTGGETYEWDLGDGTKIVKTDKSSIVHEYKIPDRRYIVWLKAIDPGTCKVKDSTSTYVDVFTVKPFVQDDDNLCAGTEYTLKSSGGALYYWTDEKGDFVSASPMPVVKPQDTTEYFVKVTGANGCIVRDSVTLTPIPLITPEFETGRMGSCETSPVIRVTNLTDSLDATDHVYFDFGDGTTTDLPEADHSFQQDGTYPVKLVAVRTVDDDVCITEQIEQIPIYKLKVPNVITPVNNDDKNATFTIQYGAKGQSPRDFGFTTSVVIYNRWGDEVFKSDDYQNDWKADGLATGIYYYEVTVAEHATCKSWLHVIK